MLRTATIVLLLCLAGSISAWNQHASFRRKMVPVVPLSLMGRSSSRIRCYESRAVRTPSWPPVPTTHGGNSPVRRLDYAFQIQATPEDSTPSPESSEPPKSLWGRIKGYFSPNREDENMSFKERLAKMGVATVLSYGMISNLSYALLVSLAWYTFSAKTRLSPLAPGQWKPFLGVYAGFWGLSIAIAPSLDRLVLLIQNRLKISKPLAIAVTVGVINVIGTTVFMIAGIVLASLLAGVPLR
ncbi:expressed unknown protein [Seminavis robusta]|uniref:Uncharacterized protein n=1 Tax=Seminavis robusta TaxID=568900 RepID=A0A9N8ESE0_9STRA|nr:expressed unknown protein [Seminavis robusta]|eukprot:Sro1819_g299710.1 n/a (241) ;mRNA; r:20001-20967